jgi:hypothetical protein
MVVPSLLQKFSAGTQGGWHEHGSVMSVLQRLHDGPPVDVYRSIHAKHCSRASFVELPVHGPAQSASVTGMPLGPPELVA